MPDDLLRMLEEMHATWVLNEDERACIAIEGAMTHTIHALLDVLRAADAMRKDCGSGCSVVACASPACISSRAYDAARARFAQAIKEGKG